MKEYSKEIGFIFILAIVVVGMNISKDNAIQEQRELFYQTMDSAKILSEHYAQKKSPVEAVEKYFAYFNDADKQALNDNSDSPFIFSIGNKITAHEKYGDSVDFEGLKAIGWAYSSINSADLVYKSLSHYLPFPERPSTFPFFYYMEPCFRFSLRNLVLQ